MPATAPHNDALKLTRQLSAVFDGRQKVVTLVVIVAVALALIPASTRGDEFPMKYLGGKAGVKKKTDGSLAVEQTEMYFKDRRGQRLFVFASDGTQASVVAKHRESGGCMFGVILLHIITVGMLNREDACERIDYFVEVTTIRAKGAETITFRSNKEQASRVANHINVWAAKTRPPPPEDESEEAR